MHDACGLLIKGLLTSMMTWQREKGWGGGQSNFEYWILVEGVKNWDKKDFLLPSAPRPLLHFWLVASILGSV